MQYDASRGAGACLAGDRFSGPLDRRKGSLQIEVGRLLREEAKALQDAVDGFGDLLVVLKRGGGAWHGCDPSQDVEWCPRLSPSYAHASVRASEKPYFFVTSQVLSAEFATKAISG